MTTRAVSREQVRPVSRLSPMERLNFLLTNRLPRRWLTLAMGRFSKIEIPFVKQLSIGLWQLFVDDLRLFEARKQEFTSLHDCFVRELKPGARLLDEDPAVLVSPCDAVVGEFGSIHGLEVLQAKGFPYTISELLVDQELADRYRDGRFVTLRLKSSMYHRFHAPCDARIDEVRYISGETWNVNPIALKVVERLFCKNERAVIELHLRNQDATIALVPIAAVLVASMRINGLNQPLDLRYRGPNNLPLRRRVEKGDELGYFEHGSTIVVFAPPTFRFSESLETGKTIRMGQALLRHC